MTSGVSSDTRGIVNGEPFAQGPNYAISFLRSGGVLCRVWQRPDLTRDEGARCAEEKVAYMRSLALTQRGLLLDMRAAPRTWGPRTNAALLDMLAPWESAGHYVVVVPADDPLQELALAKLLASACPVGGALMKDIQEGATAIAQRVGTVGRKKAPTTR